MAFVAIFSASLLSASPSDVAGAWHGRSVCATDAPACHDETVVYYIKDVPDRPDVVSIQADKIVDGKAITMGTGLWEYDRAQNTLQWRTSQQVWLLTVSGKRIEGTLRRADQTLFRKVTLAKD